VPGAACHGLSLSLSVTLPVADSVTVADALSHPVSQSVRDGQQSRERDNGVAFPVGFPPGDTARPVLAVALRDA